MKSIPKTFSQRDVARDYEEAKINSLRYHTHSTLGTLSKTTLWPKIHGSRRMARTTERRIMAMGTRGRRVHEGVAKVFKSGIGPMATLVEQTVLSRSVLSP